MPEPVAITITEHERAHEDWLTQLRRNRSRQRGITQKGRAQRLGNDDWGPEQTGARGEMAWAAYNRILPPTSVDIGHRAPDFMPDWEIRCASCHRFRLIVRDDDPPRRRYVHITAEGLRVLLWGFIWWEEMRPQWWGNPGGHGAAWFVPAAALHPLPIPEWWQQLKAMVSRA